MGRRNEAFLSFGFLEFLGEFLLLLNDTGQKAAFGNMHEGEFSGRAQNLRKGHTRHVSRIPPVPREGTGFHAFHSGCAAEAGAATDLADNVGFRDNTTMSLSPLHNDEIGVGL